MKLNTEELIKLLELQAEGTQLGRISIQSILNCSEGTARGYITLLDNLNILNGGVDRELIIQSVKLAKQKQKQQDSNRIERKTFREHARIENAVAEYGKELVSIAREQGEYLKSVTLPRTKIKEDSKAIGIFHITDWHCNELIDLPHNKYDFNVLAKRAEKMVIEAIRFFKSFDIGTVVVASTGDMLNSDRRLDELLNQATNRSKATFLASHILKHVLLHLRQHFNIHVISVLGNESRVQKEMSFSNESFSDNYDFTIFNHLKLMFEFAEIDGIQFGSIDKTEQVIDVCGQKWLLCHDLNKALNTQKDTQSLIGRYHLAGNPVDYVIGGHIHSTSTGDHGSRAASISGSNSYNEIALNLIGRASQNIHVVTGKDRHTITVDLQDTDGYEGYPVSEELLAYNAKSLSKTKKHHTIIEITI